VVIRVENLWKQYRYGTISHATLRKDFQSWWARFRGKEDPNLPVGFNKAPSTQNQAPASNDTDRFWALKDVSFEVKQGEVLGIIGKNGAGKSTLLKIMSRVTTPTKGQIKIKGRVASLLEVGTGFHPELTGRENIYLNGAILGMTKAEIKKKFDEIVSFAEIEKFIDTPVKRYSSGMYVRLAFAVAAHLEPEILIIDEVLAVGDAAFQKKCLGKMGDVAKEGRTVLFVSHNMSAIQALCQRCLLLKEGNLVIDQLSNIVVQIYLSESSPSKSFTRPKNMNGKPNIISGSINYIVQTENEHLQVNLEIFSERKCNSSLDLRLNDATGNPVGFGSLGTFNPNQLIQLSQGVNSVSFIFPTSQLAIGAYLISLDLTMPDIEYYDRVENCLAFEIARPPFKEARRVLHQSWRYGSVEFPLEKI
jgi:lipopolysaccharide transport system ATP-binding protein